MLATIMLPFQFISKPMDLQAFDAQVDRKVSRPPLARLFHVGQYVRCLIIDLQEGAVLSPHCLTQWAFESPSPGLLMLYIQGIPKSVISMSTQRYIKASTAPRWQS